MLFLGIASGVAVLAAVLWRLLRTPFAEPFVSAGFLLATIVILIGLLVWAKSGPLARGWAVSAGTPQTLLQPARSGQAAAAGTTSRVTRRAAKPPAASLPRGTFTARFNGHIAETSTGGGLVVISIDGVAGGGFRGRLHIALRGVPLDGGGVQMTDSVVGLLPHGAPAWASGTVTGLQGTQILSHVNRPEGGSERVLINLRLGDSTAVTGSIKGSPAA
jgi:hypothetical protein